MSSSPVPAAAVQTWERRSIAAISACFVLWGAAFIYRSSFVAIDGHRYFSLFDDAMISMRYAWNFAHGEGLVWNAGEWVQGYTNLLMTVAMSAPALLGDKSMAVLVVQAWGLALMLAIAALTMRISDQVLREADESRRRLLRLLAFFCALAYYPLAFWTLMGMETGLLTLLVLLAVSNAFEYVESGRRERLFVVAVSLGGAVLTRTDAVLFAGLVWAFVACELAAGGAARRRLTHLFVPLLVFAAFVVSQLAFQYWYYEALLPNTYTLKLTGMSLASRIENGLGFVAPFLRETVLILAACLAATIFTRRPRAVLLLAMMLVAIGYQVYVGGDPWNYWRIMAPTMPLAFVLVVVAIGRGVAIGSGRDADADSTMSAVAVAATMAILLSASVRFLPEVSLLRKPYLVEKSRENMNIALLLKRLTARDATVGVLFAGTIPYYLDRRAIDFLGKSDRHLATLSPDLSGRVSWSGMMSVPGHNKYDLHYSIGQLKPTYVQTLEWGSHDVTQWARDHYVLVEQQGVKLWLLKDSTAVDWNRVARRGE